MTPIRHPRHVTLMERHQKWHEIRGVSLVHFVENLVKVFDHLAEGTITKVEAPRAKVLDKDVRARVQDQWLGMQADTRDAGQVVNQPVHFAADDAVQLVVSRGKGARESMPSQHLSSRLLNV